MSYQEKESYVNIFSGILITAVYSWIVYQRHLSGQFNLTTDFRIWGKLFLIYMLVNIVARIIIYIIFHIINAIAIREEDIPVKDERIKLIQLRATRNSHYAFSGGLFISFLLLAVGMPVYGLFIAFVFSGLLSEIIENSSQIYYFRKG